MKLAWDAEQLAAVRGALHRELNVSAASAAPKPYCDEVLRMYDLVDQYYSGGQHTSAPEIDLELTEYEINIFIVILSTFVDQADSETALYGVLSDLLDRRRADRLNPERTTE